MAANGANRADARKALAQLLASALVGSGKPAQASYAYMPGDFGGQSPVLTVWGGGSLRKQVMLSTTTRQVTFYLTVSTWVLYADRDAGWTEADAEDRMDLLEKSIADVIADHPKTSDWDLLTLGDREAGTRSEINRILVGGKLYMHEEIPVEVQIIRG
jgi:hypothetical protein